VARQEGASSGFMTSTANPPRRRTRTPHAGAAADWPREPTNVAREHYPKRKARAAVPLTPPLRIPS
jgi:hypothetical protein